MTRKIVGLMLTLALALSLAWPVSLANEAETVVTLIHDTHVHGNLMTGSVGLPQKVTVVNQIRQSRPGALWVGNGDDLGGSLLSTTFEAKHITEAWNKFGVAVNAVGNHEFDLGIDVFLARVKESGFTWVSANARDKRTGEALGHEAGVRKFTVKDVNGVKVGFTGLTPENTTVVSSPGPNAEFLDVVKALNEVVPQMQEAGAQIIVALSHVCDNDSTRIANEVSGIDVILGDHCATVLEQPKVVGNTIISYVGDEYRYVGQLDLHISGGKIARFDFTRHALTADTPADPEAAAFVDGYTRELDAALGAVVGQTRSYLDARKDANRAKETALSNYIADAMRAWTQADVAVHNGGGVRASRIFAPGAITKKDVVAMLPFPNTVVKVEVTGETLLAALEHGLGEVEIGSGRFLQVSGLNLRADLTKPAGQRIVSVMVSGKPLDPKATYTLATTNFLQGGGDGYEMLKSAKVLIDAGSGPLMSMAMMEQLQSDGVIEPIVEGRIMYTAGVSFKVGENAIRFAGKPIELDQGAIVDKAGTVWLPVRAVAEAYGFQVHWNAEIGQVVIAEPLFGSSVALRNARDAKFENGRMLVPHTFLANLGLDYTMNGDVIELRTQKAGREQ